MGKRISQSSTLDSLLEVKQRLLIPSKIGSLVAKWYKTNAAFLQVQAQGAGQAILLCRFGLNRLEMRGRGYGESSNLYAITTRLPTIQLRK